MMFGDLTILDFAHWPDLAILPNSFAQSGTGKLMDFNKVSFFFVFGIFTAMSGLAQQSQLVMLLKKNPHWPGIGYLKWLIASE